MTYEIVTETVAARPIAAARRQVRSGEIGAAWRPALDQVWAFLRRQDGLWKGGHNTFVYHHAARPDGPMDVDFGVEVTGPFDGEGEVVFTHTPAGDVASTLHVGPIAELAAAHDAIHAWCAASGRALGGASWEIYGDPHDDGTFDVRVVYLLA